MSIHLTQEHRAGNGVSNSSVNEFDKDALVLGRAGDCDLVLRGAQFALKHARIVREGDDYFLEALDPVFEVTLNGKIIQRQKLSPGDSFALSSAQFRVTGVSPHLALTQSIADELEETAEAKRERYLRAIDVRSALPSLGAVSLILVLLVIGLAAGYPLVSGERRHLQSGPVTNHHRMIEAECSSCHSGGFARVSDASCQQCHALSGHAAAFEMPAHQGQLGRACVDCHREHGGTHALKPPEPELCTSCHAQIKTVYPDSTVADVSSWDAHPEFSVLLQPPSGEGKGRRVSLAAKADLADNSHVKLNHAVHLEPGLRGAEGPVTLQCGDCHQLADDFRALLPISMERHCKSCHNLQFDERLPELEVPHGEPDLVYKYLYAEYAKFLLADAAEQEAAPVRLKPGAVPQQGQTQTAFVRREVENLARAAETELFTRTACKLCHEIAEVNDRSVEVEQRSRYAVSKPQIPRHWMPGARFSHGSHEELSCESCHSGVRDSTDTADVLLPMKESCQHCHASAAGGGKLQSDCVLCHSYHDSQSLDPSRKKDWKLSSVAVGVGQ